MMESPDDLNSATVKLADMVSYLESTGWQQVKYNDRRTIVFTKPDEHSERPFVVSLPQSDAYRDYPARIEEALERVAAVEDAPFETVLRKVSTVRQDVIYLRLTLGREEYPSLDRASHFIKGMRDLVAWGACMEREQQRYFSHPFQEAREQAEHFQLAHTYQGSFGFAVESHISDLQQKPFWAGYESLPLSRRVLERITRGFLFTQQAERRDNTEELISHFDRGFNGNMCKAVVEMLEDIRGGEVAYNVHWSTSLKASADVATFEPVVLSEKTVYYLRSAANYFEKTGQQDLRGVRNITGQVIGLGFDGSGEHEVIMMAEGVGKVEFVLDEALYQVAGRAHLDRQPVTVKGRLVRRGRRGPFTLTSPRDFQILQ